jgi:hypothetical protein
MTTPDQSPAPVPPTAPTEVRYSLPDLLQEVALERGAPAFAMEKLDQVEITKLYQKTRPRRVLKSKK